MMHPELRYDLARFEHQGRIDAAARRREASAARRAQRGSWLAAIRTRLHQAGPAGSGRVADPGSVTLTGTAVVTGPVGKALAV